MPGDLDRGTPLTLANSDIQAAQRAARKDKKIFRSFVLDSLKLAGRVFKYCGTRMLFGPLYDYKKAKITHTENRKNANADLSTLAKKLNEIIQTHNKNSNNQKIIFTFDRQQNRKKLLQQFNGLETTVKQGVHQDNIESLQCYAKCVLEYQRRLEENENLKQADKALRGKLVIASISTVIRIILFAALLYVLVITGVLPGLLATLAAGTLTSLAMYAGFIAIAYGVYWLRAKFDGFKTFTNAIWKAILASVNALPSIQRGVEHVYRKTAEFVKDDIRTASKGFKELLAALKDNPIIEGSASSTQDMLMAYFKRGEIGPDKCSFAALTILLQATQSQDAIAKAHKVEKPQKITKEQVSKCVQRINQHIKDLEDQGIEAPPALTTYKEALETILKENKPAELSIRSVIVESHGLLEARRTYINEQVAAAEKGGVLKRETQNGAKRTVNDLLTSDPYAAVLPEIFALAGQSTADAKKAQQNVSKIKSWCAHLYQVDEKNPDQIAKLTNEEEIAMALRRNYVFVYGERNGKPVFYVHGKELTVGGGAMTLTDAFDCAQKIAAALKELKHFTEKVHSRQAYGRGYNITSITPGELYSEHRAKQQLAVHHITNNGLRAKLDKAIIKYRGKSDENVRWDAKPDALASHQLEMDATVEAAAKDHKTAMAVANKRTVEHYNADEVKKTLASLARVELHDVKHYQPLITVKHRAIIADIEPQLLKCSATPCKIIIRSGDKEVKVKHSSREYAKLQALTELSNDCQHLLDIDMPNSATLEQQKAFMQYQKSIKNLKKNLMPRYPKPVKLIKKSVLRLRQSMKSRNLTATVLPAPVTI